VENVIVKCTLALNGVPASHELKLMFSKINLVNYYHH